MAKKRITELATETTLKDGQYVAIDHTTDGTKKLNIGAELTDLKEELSHKAGMTEDFKQALLAIAQNVAYLSGDSQEYYDALFAALYPSLSSISCVYTQSGTVYADDSLDSLKADLVVTAHYSDSTTETINDSDYALSGTLTVGTSTITVTYGGKATTFTVTVSDLEVVSIEAVYTQSGTVYDVDSLDSLKTDLVVTATYDDSSTAIIPGTDYTLSGTLDVGTSTITVAYGGQTDTFNVTVTQYIQWSYDIDDVEVVKGAIASNTDVGGHYNTNSTYSKNRRIFMLNSGNVAMPHYTDASQPIPGDKYPIPIPPTAVKVTVSITANTQYLSLSTWNLDANDHYQRDASGAWAEGSAVATFTAGAFAYLTVLAKVNNAGSDYSDSTEPTGITITFE